jgi:hypothetical protein
VEKNKKFATMVADDDAGKVRAPSTLRVIRDGVAIALWHSRVLLRKEEDESFSTLT